MVHMRSVLAEPSLLTLIEQFVEDPLDSFTLFLILLVKAEHTNEHCMSGMHEEIGHGVETLRFVDPLGTVIPFHHSIPVDRNDGRIGAVGSCARSILPDVSI